MKASNPESRSNGTDFRNVIAVLEENGYRVTSIELERIRGDFANERTEPTGATLIRITPMVERA
jgi:hypothetical protein